MNHNEIIGTMAVVAVSALLMLWCKGGLGAFLGFPFKVADWLIRMAIHGLVFGAYALISFALAIREAYSVLKVECSMNYRTFTRKPSSVPSGLERTLV